MVLHELELDSAVRDWVFIPLSLCILLMKLLTQYAHMVSVAWWAGRQAGAHSGQQARAHAWAAWGAPPPLMPPTTQFMSAQAPPSTKDLKEVREQQLVTRSQRLRAAGRILPEGGFKMRKEYLAKEVLHGACMGPWWQCATARTHAGAASRQWGVRACHRAGVHQGARACMCADTRACALTRVHAR